MSDDDRTESAVPGGITLRDWLAGQALVGYLSAHAGDGVQFPHEDEAAGWAYAYADAMIARRMKAE